MRSALFPERELREAREFCEREGIRHLELSVQELEIEGFRQNPPNRCYLCKRELFERILRVAAENRLAAVAEGSNLDDEGDYRPGLLAVAELHVESPLRQVRLSKEEIRFLSRELGLSTWGKPSFACLASRFVYGETITEEKLAMVEKAERLLLDSGFYQARVRIHGTIARIEVLPEELGKLLEEKLRAEIAERLRDYGFSYVTVDLQGYRTGSMNETLRPETREALGAQPDPGT